MFRILIFIWLRNLKIYGHVQTFKEIFDDFVLILDVEDLFLLLLLKHLEFFIKISFQFENDLTENFNLDSLSLYSVKFEGLVKEVEDVRAFYGSFQIFELTPGLDDLPVKFLHTLDITSLELVLCGESSFLISVAFLCFLT